jgi:hypothetical protein
MEILQNRIAKQESQNQALNMLLIAVCMSLGLNRYSPFVTHSEIEAALLSMQDLTVNGAYGDDPKSTAETLLSLYRGDHGEDLGRAARHLHIVPKADMQADE